MASLTTAERKARWVIWMWIPTQLQTTHGNTKKDSDDPCKPTKSAENRTMVSWAAVIRRPRHVQRTSENSSIKLDWRYQKPMEEMRRNPSKNMKITQTLPNSEYNTYWHKLHCWCLHLTFVQRLSPLRLRKWSFIIKAQCVTFPPRMLITSLCHSECQSV